MTELHHRYFPWKFLRFWEAILDGGFQSYPHRQNMLKIGIKLTNVASINVIFMSLV